MVQLVVTPQLKQTLDSLTDAKSSPLPLELLESVQRHLDNVSSDWIDHALLARIAKWNSNSEAPRSEYSLRSLLRGTEVYIQTPIARERSPELEAILAPIRLTNERALYAQYITSSIQPDHKTIAGVDFHSTTSHSSSHWNFKNASAPATTVAQEWKSVRQELSAVANVCASMAAVATAVWWALGNEPYIRKTLLSLLGALTIAAIEAFLYIRFFTLSRAPPKQPKKKRQIAIR